MTAVRPLGVTDERVWRDLFTAYGVFYKTDFTDDVLDRVWALLIADGSGVDALIATDDSGAVIGFAHYRSHPDTFTGNRDWFLDDLYVRPEARGMGGATTLIEALRGLAAEGDGVLRWITADDNHTAQRVYDRIAKRTTWVTYEMKL